MSRTIGISGYRPRFSRIVSGAPAYLADRVIYYPCQDGAAGYPTLTDSVAGANATIYSASAAESYPGGQAFPRFDGINDYATAGNVAVSNITERLAICVWLREHSSSSGLHIYFGKRDASTGIQYLLYRYGSQYRFLISSTGGASTPGATLITLISSGAVTGRDLFLCGVYQYKTNGTSEVRLFMNHADAGTLALVATSSSAAGPLYTSAAPLALAAHGNGASFTSFANVDIKSAELHDIDASRIGDWIDGTNPGLRFAAGSGQ